MSCIHFGAGWSSPVARQAHNLKVAGSNPAPATNKQPAKSIVWRVFVFGCSLSFRSGITGVPTQIKFQLTLCANLQGDIRVTGR